MRIRLDSHDECAHNERIISVSCSVELSGDLSNSGNEVDSATSHKHRGLAIEGHLGSSIDLGRGHGIDAIAVLGKCQVTESHEVTSDLLKAVALVLKVHHDVHLEDVLGSGQFTV